MSVIQNIGTALLQATNTAMLIMNSTADIRKFTCWNSDGDEVLSGLEITDVSFEDNIKIFEHPIETGTVITDHMIVEPKEASVTCLISIDDSTTLNELYNLYLSGEILKLRASNKIIDECIIKNAPFKLSAEYFDKTPYTISFREVQHVTPVYVKMSNAQSASSTSRVNTGVKQAATVNKSWMADTWDGIKSFFQR